MMKVTAEEARIHPRALYKMLGWNIPGFTTTSLSYDALLNAAIRLYWGNRNASSKKGADA